MSVIIVSVEGGLVQNIENIPEHVVVQVWDYDVEGADPEELETDHAGREYSLSEYGA